ncbi:ABC transporter permease [Geodermatophilus sp. TF02-6]|uniref:ABC transporter permease n=1 Tax=Geodermatophilus sp. TF02-6 TaxID=2250575 RepID=UPI000DE879D0|nr:ABC transporter permease [Geodermatophilus sp. TF02-6]RBY76098.1 ABC transporter permease [Geodermatophilus sp. TF02-6]
MTAAVRTVPERAVPPLGGFSTTFLRLEIRRLLRNRRTMVFTLVMPPAFYLLFGGLSDSYQHQSAGHGNVSAYLMLSFAVYGAMIANTSAGASVAVERAQGWSRQLRLTPLDPVAYTATKVITAMVVGAASVAIVFVVGGLGGAHMPTSAWITGGLVAWLGAVVFAAFGLFMGYLLPSENVMQLLGPALALLALMGGLFVPLDALSSTLRTLASYTPAYGVGELARAGLLGDGIDLGAIANVVVWTAFFAAGAVWRFRRDTARV